MRNIHKFIFQDVYYFAGRFRLEDICKGDTFFCKSQFIEDRLKLLLIRLAKENHLQGLNADDFAQSTAAFVRCGGFTIRLYVGTLYEAAKRASLFFFEIMVTIRALSRALLERHLR